METETQLIVPKAITEKHDDIGRIFSDKIIELLLQRLDLKTYGADDENWAGPLEKAVFFTKNKKFKITVELQESKV